MSSIVKVASAEVWFPQASVITKVAVVVPVPSQA